jgi:superfamily I DNA/RNA helicase
VALHRVRYLADRLPAADEKDILFTTFSKNLAGDLRSRLLELGGPGLLQRVEVVNIDALAARIATEAEPSIRRHTLDDTKAATRWHDLLLELGETGWSAEFLHDEWSQVVLGHAVNSREEYFRVRRAGRGRTLSRPQRAEVWQLVEQYTKRLADEGCGPSARSPRAARLEAERAKTKGTRYKYVVVDEAQDLSPAHWMLLRAMAAPGPNDLFLVGDTHQRIYDNYLSLSSLGINIRGRSSRLTSATALPMKSSALPRPCSVPRSGMTSTAAPTPSTGTGPCCGDRGRRCAAMPPGTTSSPGSSAR